MRQKKSSQRVHSKETRQDKTRSIVGTNAQTRSSFFFLKILTPFLYLHWVPVVSSPTPTTTAGTGTKEGQHKQGNGQTHQPRLALGRLPVHPCSRTVARQVCFKSGQEGDRADPQSVTALTKFPSPSHNTQAKQRGSACFATLFRLLRAIPCLLLPCLGSSMQHRVVATKVWGWASCASS